MNTLIIFTTFEDLPFYFLVAGDKRHLNDLIANTAGATDEQTVEICSLLSATEKTGRGDYWAHPPLSLADAMQKVAGNHVISIGLAP